jgi:hypothetical protein
VFVWFQQAQSVQQERQHQRQHLTATSLDAKGNKNSTSTPTAHQRQHHLIQRGTSNTETRTGTDRSDCTIGLSTVSGLVPAGGGTTPPNRHFEAGFLASAANACGNGGSAGGHAIKSDDSQLSSPPLDPNHTNERYTKTY